MKMDWFTELGLNSKQQKLYLHVLEHGAQSASELADGLKEQRTNIYLIVEELEGHGLIVRNEDKPIARFEATNPNQLQKLMLSKQKRLANSASQMKKVLPELLGLYQLSNKSPGFAYFEGIKGYTAALEDMIRSHEEVCVFGASNVSRARPDAWKTLQEKLQKRAKAKISTRILFEDSLESTTDIESRKRQKMEVRFWGNAPFEGEVAIYGSTVVLTTYDESLTSLVIKNLAIAKTMQSIFDTAWNSADKK